MANYFASLLTCTLGRASDSNNGPDIHLFVLIGWDVSLS